MTLESTNNKNRYIGNGSTKTFNFTFKIWKKNQIKVFVGDGKTETDMSPYVSVAITSSGGTVTFSSAPKSGQIIVIRRNMPYVQEDDYRNGSRFDAEEVEDRFDMDCAERQDLLRELDRAIKIPVTSSKTPEQIWAEFESAGSDVLAAKNLVYQWLQQIGTAPTSDIINALGFGAVRTGRSAGYLDSRIAANTSAVQAAINAAHAAGWSVWVPEGVLYRRGGIDDKGVLIIDDSSGVRITSRDYWWHPSRSAPPKLILHRGLSSVYPENTVLAFDAAGIGGAWGIETDIQWTSDGYPVCMHDNTIDRTTTGTGTVQSKTLAQIRALDAGSWVDAAYSSCLVPTFEEYLDSCMLYGCVPVIEIKSADNVNLTKISGLIDTLRGYGLTEHAFFTAFDWSYLALVREKSKEIGVCGVKSGELTEDNLKYLQWLGGKVYYGPYIDDLDANEVSLLRACGIDIYPWTGFSQYRYDVASRFGCGKILVNNFFV